MRSKAIRRIDYLIESYHVVVALEGVAQRLGRGTDSLIDSYHVSFESGAGWLCACAEFTAQNDCRHTREAQGRHAAQALISNRLISAIDGSGYRR